MVSEILWITHAMRFSASWAGLRFVGQKSLILLTRTNLDQQFGNRNSDLLMVFAGILGGLVAAATAYLAPDANAPVMKFGGSKQVPIDITTRTLTHLFDKVSDLHCHAIMGRKTLSAQRNSAAN